MKSKALRLYGKSDVRLEEFTLPEIKDGEILAKVITDTLCMSSYKAAIQGEDHKRVPSNIATNPVILGHEFCGELVKVGAKYADKFKVGQRFAIQPAINYKGSLDSPGYSFEYIGGNATYIIIPEVVMEMDCLLPYEGEAFFLGSLAEPVSCVVGSFNANYHTENGKYVHKMGIKEGGNLCIIAGCGPMGICAIQHALAAEKRPAKVVVTDIDAARIERAKTYLSPEYAKKQGVELIYQNTADCDALATLMSLTDGYGYDDVFVMAPIPVLIEQGDAILARDGCLNFFAGPSDTAFKAPINFYNVHYNASHLAAASGGNNDDLIEVLGYLKDRKINPSFMITHVGGLDCVGETTLNLPKIPGGKKLIYTQISMPLTAIDDFAKLGESDPFFAKLAQLCPDKVWTLAAEQYIMENGKAI